MCIQPGTPLAAGFTQYPATDGYDISALFRNGYEILGEHNSALRLAPSNEGLGPGEGLRFEIHLRLVVQHEFAAVQSVAQIALDGLPLQRMLVHRRLEKLIIIPTIVLGA